MRRYYRIMRKIGWPLILCGVFFLLAGCATKPAPQTTPGQPEPVSQPKAITDIDISEDDAIVRVAVRADEPLTYTAVKHQFPLAVVLYFPDTTLKGVSENYTPSGNTIVNLVQATSLENVRPSSRIEIRLHKDVPYKVTRSESEVLVLFKKEVASVETTQAQSPATEPMTPEKTEPAVATADTNASSAQSKPVEPAAAQYEEDKTVEKISPNEKTALLERIDFEVLKTGPSRITVETDRKVDWETVKSTDNQLLIKFYHTMVPKFQKRPLITTRFNSAVDRILPIQTEKTGDTAVLAVELRESVPYKAHSGGDKGNIYMVDFEPSSVPPRATPDAEKSVWVQTMQQTEEIVSLKTAPMVEAPVMTKAGKTYTGEKISLDFQDAEIHNIFRILHEVSGKNFVIGDDVKGRVTLKLVNVPWDQVLDLILHMNKLGTIVEGNVVRIATLATLKAEQDALAQKRQSEAAAKELEPLTTEYVRLNYAKASELKSHLDQIKTTRGKVTIDESTNIVILNDEQGAIEQARVLISELDKANQEIATRQVMIEARIVEADSNFSRDIGVQWGGDYGEGTLGTDGTSTLLFGGNSYTARNSTATSPNFAVNLPPASFTSGIGFALGRIAGTSLNLDIRLLAMEQQGKGRTISSPKVLTLDNQEAIIKQITKIPFQVIEEGTVSIKTEEAGIQLKVTPHITRDERIRMKIFAEKGAPDWSNTVSGNPAIDTNTADTELFVNDGQTVVIGGILTTVDTLSESRTPLLNQIPVLGWLFKTKSTVRNKQELLIFITPRIIKLENSEHLGG